MILRNEITEPLPPGRLTNISLESMLWIPSQSDPNGSKKDLEKAMEGHILPCQLMGCTKEIKKVRIQKTIH